MILVACSLPVRSLLLLFVMLAFSNKLAPPPWLLFHLHIALGIINCCPVGAVRLFLTSLCQLRVHSCSFDVAICALLRMETPSLSQQTRILIPIENFVHNSIHPSRIHLAPKSLRNIVFKACLLFVFAYLLSIKLCSPDALLLFISMEIAAWRFTDYFSKTKP
jgi:hypothetical protein